MADISKEDLRKEIAGKCEFPCNLDVCDREITKTSVVEFFCAIFPHASGRVSVQIVAFSSCSAYVCLKLAHKQWPHDAMCTYTIL